MGGSWSTEALRRLTRPAAMAAALRLVAIARAQTAREAIEHALRCPREDFLQCPNLASVLAARLTGQPLRQAHSH